MVPLAEALTMLLQARGLLARNQGHRAYQEVRAAALTIQRAASNGGVKPEMGGNCKPPLSDCLGTSNLSSSKPFSQLEGEQVCLEMGNPLKIMIEGDNDQVSLSGSCSR